MNEWEKIKHPDKSEYKNKKISFFLTERGCLEDIKWHDAAFSAKILDLKINTGNLYQRDSLNKLPDMLSFPCCKILKESFQNKLLTIEIERLIHDITLKRTIKANGTSGCLEFFDQIKKSGPGKLRMQLNYETILPESEKFRVALIPSRSSIHAIWADTPAHHEVRDQDTHTIRRSWNTDKSYVEFGEEGSHCHLSFSSEKSAFTVCELTHKSNPGYLYCQNYGNDFYLNKNENIESHVTYSPHLNKSKIQRPAKSNDKKKLEKKLLKKLESIENSTAAFETRKNKIRLNLISWKIGEFKRYLTEANYHECEMQLNDAESALAAIKKGLPLVLPPAGDILYEDSFEKQSDDWDFYGLGKIECSSENGIHIVPNVTMNMWSKQEFSGDFLIEFDFFASSDHLAGGTFLQLCARPNVERDDYNLMCSATGYMPDYNFGISCYHLSFNRGASQPGQKMTNVCNFRKTGKGFYLLSQIPDPVPERKKWYRLSLAKKDSRFIFAVNGKVVQEYIDCGYQGKILNGGKIGIRNWARQSAFIKKLKVFRIN
ncbi:MAG: hypothetical protein UT30_C0032G0004 [Candidatus Uhrbacteria bacterium GW2011_GWF2_39_13]|uniref:Uncharacterized protein n=1 Tax=Candidatus Uhrbacteria bacterium GW2011_GWF2_39_13 TaxID=1618995 RepID=A0A0G0PYV0_9BACT|nr:MAG: hypothetical protein UT30_C0032G0004 [Candidatus Uhrbacteria bacterium GW2011_GWF2_39_13]